MACLLKNHLCGNIIGYAFTERALRARVVVGKHAARHGEDGRVSRIIIKTLSYIIGEQLNAFERNNFVQRIDDGGVEQSSSENLSPYLIIGTARRKPKHNITDERKSRFFYT